MGERDVKIEEQEIDHARVHETVGQIPHHSGEKKTERNVPPEIGTARAQEKSENKKKRDRRKHNEERVVVSEGTKGRARVRDVDDVEVTGNDDARHVRIDLLNHKPLRDLIERVKRQREAEKKFHVDLGRDAPPGRPTFFLNVTLNTVSSDGSEIRPYLCQLPHLRTDRTIRDALCSCPPPHDDASSAHMSS